MKKALLVLSAVALFSGCESPVCEEHTGSVASVDMVRIGLSHTSYQYVEVIANDVEYGVHYVGGTPYVDTHWMEVPNVDTVTMITRKENEIFRIHPVLDSVYDLRK